MAKAQKPDGREELHHHIKLATALAKRAMAEEAGDSARIAEGFLQLCRDVDQCGKDEHVDDLTYYMGYFARELEIAYGLKMPGVDAVRKREAERLAKQRAGAASAGLTAAEWAKVEKYIAKREAKDVSARTACRDAAAALATGEFRGIKRRVTRGASMSSLQNRWSKRMS